MWLAVQEQGSYLQQQLAAAFQQLQAKDAQLTAVQQHLQQAQHAQQAQHTQQAEQPLGQDTAQEAAGEVVTDLGSVQTSASSSNSVAARHLQSQSASQKGSPEQPQLRAVKTQYVESQEATDAHTPRSRLVSQRIKELQSRQSSPEKTLSSSSSVRLDSPRSRLRGEFDISTRVGLFGEAVNSPRARPEDSSPRAGPREVPGNSPNGSHDIRQDVQRPFDTSPRASVSGPREAPGNSPSAGHDVRQDGQRALDTSPRASVSGMTPQQLRRATAVSDVSDSFGPAAGARRPSRSATPPQDRLNSSVGLQRISPRFETDRISSSGLQMPSHAHLTDAHDNDSSAGIELGSPEMELASDGDSEAGNRGLGSAEVGTGGEYDGRMTGGPSGGAVLLEDSMQFGPEASAMSLPGMYNSS